MARILDDEDETTANELLDHTQEYLKIQGLENARIWYAIGALLLACVFFILAGLIWFNKSYLISWINKEVFEIIIGAITGGVGALFFVVQRSNKILMDPAAGRWIHYLESCSRILAGVLGAFLIALAIKENILLGVTTDLSPSNSFIILLVLCFCAGASERLVPGFIKKIEDSSSPDSP